MIRRRWLVAGALLAGAALTALLALFTMLASLYSVVIDLLEIVTLPHG